MIRRIIMAIVAAAVVALVSLFILSWRPAIAQIKQPNALNFSAESIAHGEVLAAEGHCASCHTRPGGQPFAGGYGLSTPFGIIYGTNITPDPNTGIGRWSLTAFTRAMREGVARDGSHLYPAFPYYAYTKLTDTDIGALYAYVMTRTAVNATVPANTVPFPLNLRFFEEGWKILFFRRGGYSADTSKSQEWNRGAYLAEALSDCTGCHTPRNPLGAEETKRAYAGALVEGWIAPALTQANPSPLPWTQEELFSYLRTGVSPLHGATDATMTQVIRGALALPIVPDSDVQAIALYFRDMERPGAAPSNTEAIATEALASSKLGSEQEYDPDANLYAAACMSCHYNAGPVPLNPRPELALISDLRLSEPTNFIQVVLRGVSTTDGAQGLMMPAYASSLTDSEVARLAAYLRRTRTNLPPWGDVEDKVAAIRRQLPKPK